MGEMKPTPMFNIGREDLSHYPGPIDLVYGAESPVRTEDVASQFSFARKRKLPIRHVSFLGCQFCDSIKRVFRVLGRKLKRVRHIRELAISGIPQVGNEEIRQLAPFFRGNISLEVLDLGGSCCLGDDGTKTVITALQEGKSKINVLGLEICGLGHIGATSIAQFMRQGKFVDRCPG